MKLSTAYSIVEDYEAREHAEACLAGIRFVNDGSISYAAVRRRKEMSDRCNPWVVVIINENDRKYAGFSTEAWDALYISEDALVSD